MIYGIFAILLASTMAVSLQDAYAGKGEYSLHITVTDSNGQALSGAPCSVSGIASNTGIPFALGDVTNQRGVVFINFPTTTQVTLECSFGDSLTAMTTVPTPQHTTKTMITLLPI